MAGRRRGPAKRDPFDELADDLREKKIRPVYLIFGKESFLIHEVRMSLEEAALEGGMGSFNKTVLVGGRTKADEVTEAVRTLPMLGGRKLVVVENIDVDDKGHKNAKKLAPVQEALADAAKAAYGTTVLLMTATEVDRRRKLFKAVKKNGLAIECKPLYRQALANWIRRDARRLGKDIDQDAIQLLVDMAGNDLGKLHNELVKLSHYVFDRRRIELEDAEEVVADLKLSTVFDLVDAIGSRSHNSLAEALLAMRKLRESGAQPVNTLFFITMHFRRLLQAADYRAGGMNDEEACRAAGMKLPWKAVDQLRRWRPGALRKAMARIAQTDDDLRGSKVPGWIQLDRLVMELCGKG